MSEVNVHINPISNRQYILSPAVQSGRDKESSNKDFYQEDVVMPSLGRLGFGMKVVHSKTQIQYTIINIEKEKVDKLNLQDKINKTIKLMYETSHPYLFRLLNHYETEGHVFLIFEPYDGDSLDHIIEQGKCDVQTALKYFVEVLLGLQHMHAYGYYNLNIYPENILIGECVKLTDYGIKMTGKSEEPKREIRYLKKGELNYPVNAYHTPEEIMGLLEGKIIPSSRKTDSWNCGILLFEMLTNFKSPFKGETDEKYFNALVNAEVDLSLIEDDFCKDLISRLLTSDPNDRINIEDILNMEYIKNINIEQPEIDPSDNIINPEKKEEKDIENEENNNNNNNEEETEDKDAIITRLKSENDFLKEALKIYKEEGEDKASKLKSLKSGNIKNGDIVPKGESSKGILKTPKNENEKEKENNENKEELKEEDKSEHNSSSSSSSGDDSGDIDDSSSEEDLNSETLNLYDRSERFREKYQNSKKKIRKLKKKIKNLNNSLAQLQKEKKQIEEQKTLNILNNFEKINANKINDINELSNIVLNSVNLFRDSQQNLETLIEKLITISAEEHISLIEENKKYIDNKGKVFFEALDNINTTGNKQTEIDYTKEKEERRKADKKKDMEILDLKSKYELSKQKEALLNERIKALEERNNATKELNKNLMRKQEELDKYYQIIARKKESEEGN
jgi:serine/threonine protein kinase